MHMENVSKVINKDGYMIVSLPNENTIYHRILSLIGVGADTYAFKLFKHLHMPTSNKVKIFITIW